MYYDDFLFYGSYHFYFRFFLPNSCHGKNLMALQKKYHLIEAVVAVFEKMDEPLFLIISNEIVIAFSKEESSSYERLSLINSIHHLIEKASLWK